MVVDTKFGHIFRFTHLSVLFVGLDCLVPPASRLELRSESCVFFVGRWMQLSSLLWRSRGLPPNTGRCDATAEAVAGQDADAEDDGRHDQPVRHRSRLEVVHGLLRPFFIRLREDFVSSGLEAAIDGLREVVQVREDFVSSGLEAAIDGLCEVVPGRTGMRPSVFQRNSSLVPGAGSGSRGSDEDGDAKDNLHFVCEDFR